MRILIFICLFLICLSRCLAQNSDTFEPSKIITENTKFIDAAKKKLDSDLLSLSDIKNKKVKEYISSRYKNRFDFYKEAIADGDFYFDSKLNTYIGKIITLLRSANTEIPDVTLFVSRYSSANAFNTGDGNIVINVGLLNKIENDGQFAFIIAHEAAHQYLQHVNLAIKKKAEKYMSDEMAKQIKATLKEEYNVRKKIQELLLPKVFDDMKFSRMEELEADSLGLYFMLKAGFDTAAAISTMQLLGRVDKIYDEKEMDLKSLINVTEVTFRDQWLNSSSVESSLGMITPDKDTLMDSLKTHPDTKLRIESLRKQFTQQNVFPTKIYMTNLTDFKSFQLLAEEEMIYSYFHYSNLGRMMFQAFHLKSWYPENEYANTMISIGFARLHDLQRQHQVQTEVALPDKDYEKNYNNFIGFLNNVKIEETASLSYYTLRPSDETKLGNEDYLFALLYSSREFKKTEEVSHYKTEYLNRFPKGRYLNFIITNN